MLREEAVMLGGGSPYRTSSPELDQMIIRELSGLCPILEPGAI